MKSLTFIAGAAVGYVLGTKAGRERYQQIVDGARNLREQPMVTQAQAKAKELVDSGSRTVKSKLGVDDATTAEFGTAASAPGPRRSTSDAAASQL